MVCYVANEEHRVHRRLTLKCIISDLDISVGQSVSFSWQVTSLLVTHCVLDIDLTFTTA